MIPVSDYRKWLITLLDALGSKNWNLGRSGGSDWDEVKQSQSEIVNFVDSIVAVKDAEIAALKERQITPEMMEHYFFSVSDDPRIASMHSGWLQADIDALLSKIARSEGSKE
jgi:hypothetical protein